MTDYTLPDQPNSIIVDADQPSLNLREVWQYRELMGFLIWREWSVRYKQTALGIGWIILQPIATTLIFSTIFGLIFRAPTEIPFPVFFLCGYVIWKYFSDALNRASMSLVNSSHLISKVYFPRLILPFGSVISPLADFLVASLVLLVTILIYQINPLSIRLFTLPLFVGCAMLIAIAIGLWFSAMNVRYRDVAQLLPFILQVWMYASPIIYPMTLVEETFPDLVVSLYQLNPMVGIVQGFRWALVDGAPPDMLSLAIGMGVVLIVLLGGLRYFTRMEQSFGDII